MILIPWQIYKFIYHFFLFINMKEVYLNKTIYSEYFQVSLFTLVCLAVPMFLGHSQVFVGVIINMFLVLAALRLNGYKLLPVIIVPSIGAYVGGLLFGGASVYLLYFIPFIWLANGILVYSFKRNISVVKKVFFGSFFKALFLFVIALSFYSLGLIPSMFLIAMGPLQLLTALIGSSLGVGVNKIKL